MFNVDESMPLTESGVWAEFEKSKFLIAHMTNLKFQRALNRLQFPHRKKIEAGTMDPKLAKDLMCEAMSEGLVLDWQNVIGADKQAIPYSPDAAKKALLNRPDFREFVASFANDLDNFRDQAVEEMGKS